MKIETAWTDDIVIGERHRALDDTKVLALSESMAVIGLQQPVTLYVETKDDGEEIIHLVAGLHRLKAALRLGWERIDAIYTDLPAIDRELWEIAENLHRVDLTKEQRDQHIRRYAELLEARGAEKVPQSAALSSSAADKPTTGRGNKGTAQKIADRTGLSKDTVQRALNRTDPAEQERRDAEKEVQKRQRDNDNILRVRAAEEFAEWLLANSDIDFIPTLITWIEAAQPRDVIAAIRRPHMGAA